MASSSDSIVGIVTQGDSPLLSRAVTIAVAGVETVVMVADLAGITFLVYDLETRALVSAGPPEALDPATVIDDTPPTTGLLAGMNFSFQLDGDTYLPKGYRVYVVQVSFELTGGQVFTRSWLLSSENLLGF